MENTLHYIVLKRADKMPRGFAVVKIIAVCLVVAWLRCAGPRSPVQHMWYTVSQDRAPIVVATHPGFGVCVSLRYALLVVGLENGVGLAVYSLMSGTCVRRVECGRCNARTQLCIAPEESSVLVTLQGGSIEHVDIMGRGSSPRLRTIGAGIVQDPRGIDCNERMIVVVDSGMGVRVFSWLNARLLYWVCAPDFGYVDVQLRRNPMGQPAFVVMNNNTNVATLSSLDGTCLQQTCFAASPTFSGVECLADNCIYSAELEGLNRCSYDSASATEVCRRHVWLLCPLTDGGVGVQYSDECHIFPDIALRRAWVWFCSVAT